MCLHLSAQLQISAWFMASRDPVTGDYPDLPAEDAGGSRDILDPPPPPPLPEPKRTAGRARTSSAKAAAGEARDQPDGAATTTAAAAVSAGEGSPSATAAAAPAKAAGRGKKGPSRRSVPPCTKRHSNHNSRHVWGSTKCCQLSSHICPVVRSGDELVRRDLRRRCHTLPRFSARGGLQGCNPCALNEQHHCHVCRIDR